MRHLFPPAGMKATLALAALLLVATAALAGDKQDVKGRITGNDKLIPDVYSEAAKPENHRWNWREPSPTVPPGARVLAGDPSREVCIAAFVPSPQPALQPVLVKVTGGRTIPATIVVTPGTRLSFKNVDPFVHSLFQVNEPKFGPIVTGVNSSREWTAPSTAARYEIRDTLFPSLRMYVRVETQVVGFVYPSARDGSFTLQLAPGDYVLKAFFAGNQVGKDVTGVHVVATGPFELKDPIQVGGDAK